MFVKASLLLLFFAVMVAIGFACRRQAKPITTITAKNSNNIDALISMPMAKPPFPFSPIHYSLSPIHYPLIGL